MPERPVKLRSANLNLVPVLHALLRESSVTKAAASLALSPSATSCALAELRLLFADPLLVRVGRQMYRTPRAEALMTRLDRACQALEELLQEDAFDPSRAERTFVVAAVDCYSLWLAPALAARLRVCAPGVRLRIVDVPGDLERQLAIGAVDVGLVAVNILPWAGVAKGLRFTDHMVGLVDARHPLAQTTRPDAASVHRYGFVDWEPSLDLAARVGGFERSDPAGGPLARCLVQSYGTLPFMVIGTDMIARMPQVLARWLVERLPLRLFELPYDPLTIEIAPLWNVVHDADPAQRWFRNLLIDALTFAHSQPIKP